MNTRALPILVAALAVLVSSAARAAETVPLSALDLSRMSSGWGRPQVDKAVTGKPLSIAGRVYERGVGTHARSVLWVELRAGAERFQAWVGVDDAAGNAKGQVEFRVIVDGRSLFRSGPMKHGEAARAIDLDLRGAQRMLLMVTDGGNGLDFDHANWADARFTVRGEPPRAMAAPREEAVVLTPKPGLAPRLNGPAILGGRPGNPFLHRIPTTGERPMVLAASGLPRGIVLDAARGILTGTNPPPGQYRITLKAANRHGSARKRVTLVSGAQLALTPPMGWNHWYAHYNRITDAMMREAADLLVRSGMADVGYQYVSIDDCWMNAPKADDPQRVGPLRDAAGNLVPNRHFPNMKGLADYIHAYGLKAGIYTSPGPLTCGGFAGSYQHEEQDARQFAAWGFDLLKYDWCSYSEVVKGDLRLENLKAPYLQMGALLRAQPRDIVLNLCQYGMGNVWEWGAEVGGHSWRTAGDLGFELDRIFEVALANAAHRAFNGPGRWNDPDYIQIGYVGAAHGMGEPRPCPLSPNEQYAYMSLWSLMAAPLFFSGDLTRLDDFTLNVLCNPEVIEVNQDPMGQCARVIPTGDETFLMVKDLADGSRAVGLFNRGEFAADLVARWSEVGVRGRQPVRDLWRQTDLGRYRDEFRTSVPRRGVVMVRIGLKD